jgi:hypothetical protein
LEGDGTRAWCLPQTTNNQRPKQSQGMPCNPFPLSRIHLSAKE